MAMELNSKQRSGWLARAWTACVNFLIRTVPMWALMSLAAAGIFALLALDSRTSALDTQRRTADARTVDFNLYVQQLVTYNQGISAHDVCISGVEGSRANRAQHQLIVDQLVLAGYPDVAAALRSGPLLSRPIRTVDECPAILPVPIPPDGVTPATGITTLSGETP